MVSIIAIFLIMNMKVFNNMKIVANSNNNNKYNSNLNFQL